MENTDFSFRSVYYVSAEKEGYEEIYVAGY